ncbi:alginate export family protein [Chitinophaga defluvii]|uniref:Alginate export family protein n=1 Tax=Chitinophaga defluvii TaxID=3163343 RepID=A0ABV2T4Y2_9BACT
MHKLLLLFIMSGISSILYAQEFKIDGQLRPRLEVRNGFGQLRPSAPAADQTAAFISGRTRLNFLYNDAGNKVKFGLSLQDIRVWGDHPQTTLEENNNFGIHEGWAAILFSPEWDLKLGRQEINLDNARILGNLDWAQQARSHDAILLNYSGVFNLKAGYALSAGKESLRKEIYTIRNYKNLQFLWLNKKISHITISLLFLNNGMEYTKDSSQTGAAGRAVAYSQTIGARMEFRKALLGFNMEGYYQGGKDDVHHTLSAYDLIAEAVVKPDKWQVTLGTEILSGTAATTTAQGENRSFNPLYGTNHKFNGYLDFFYVGGRYKDNAGLHDIYTTAVYMPDPFSIEAGLHLFNTMVKVVDKNGDQLNRYLGMEADIVAGYRLSPVVNVQGGFSVLSGTATLQTVAGGDKNKLSTWGWLAVNITPTFLHIKK